MFFRRVFSRKDHDDDDDDDMQQSKVDTQSLHLSNPTHSSPYRSQRRSSIPYDEKQQRNLSSAIQLTPLWETIIRTKRLPDKMNISSMFDEFAERLRDPEWQVRQHALKVLIDVLIVMSDRADLFFQPLICPLVENLGHSAPAIRKGALDALKVYMTETAMPETIILEIISLGMEQKTYFEQFDGRVCVGVMLSLPSLVYTSLGTPKQNYIVRTAIEALTKKMLQVTYQEVALKVLLRIREMIGVREFSEHIAHAAYRDFELLCNVYGLPSTPNLQADPSLDLYMPQTTAEANRVWNPVMASTAESNCKVKRTELCWREKADETSADEENNNISTPSTISNNNNHNNVASAVATTIVPATANITSAAVPTLTIAPTQATIICNGNSSEKKNCGGGGGGITTTVIGVTSKKVDNEKVIMETEINIENTAVTMRILEANSNSSENEVTAENSEDDLSSVSGGAHQNAVVRIMTDSEMDDTNGGGGGGSNMVIDVPLKRVTFGEEVTVKLRTPDSDSVLQSDNDNNDAQQKAIQQIITQQQQIDDRTLSSISAIVPNHNSINNNNLNGSSDRMELSQSSPNHLNSNSNDNNFLKVTRPKTASIVITSSSPPISPSDSDSTKLNLQRHKSASPAKRSRRPSYSSDDLPILSPKAPHKGIEVLHNLQQRSPSASPTRSRRNSFVALEQNDNQSINHNSAANMENNKNVTNLTQSPRSPKIMVPKLAMDHILVVEEISSPEMNRKNSIASIQIKSWENLGLVDDLCLRNLKCGDWRLRSNAMCTIEEMLKSTENLSLVQPYLESLLRTLLSSEKHPDVIEDKRRILINLISRLPLDNLEDRATQILIGLCRQGGAGSNRVAKALMQRLPPTAVVIKLISDDFLKAHSSKFRENALQMVLYALMTFPSTYFDIPTCVKKSAEAATDQKKRVRQAALDVLAVLGQISAPKTILEEVTETLQHEKEAHRLIAAIKARLSRKQLPSVTPEGSVHYALRIPTPPQVASNYYFGADIDWITAGIGSVSPVSSKKRFDPTQLAYNYSSSDSNRSVDFMRRPGKDLHAYNMGSSSELEGPIPQSVRDDKNTHFVMAATVPASHMRYYGPGSLQKLQLQSQSFPDLTHRIDTKIGPYTSNKLCNGDGINKLAKLPATSRFPSMEANMEARIGNTNINKINDTNYYNGRRYSTIYTSTGNNTVLVRPNASLPRKLHTSLNRNAYYGYSHGTLNSQSSNDESRPSTQPDEYLQQSPPKRFVNVEKYLDDSSSDSGSPLKTLHDIRYPMKSPNLDDRMLQTEELNRRNVQQSEFEKISIENGDIINRSQNNTTPRKSVAAQSIQSNNKQSNVNVNQQANEADSDDDDVSIGISLGKNSPVSHASAATTRSIHDSNSPDLDSRSKSAHSVGQASIQETNAVNLNAPPPAENGTSNSETIDTSLEHIQNENNEKLMAEESKEEVETSDTIPGMVEDSDTIDSAEKTAEIRIETQPEQLLDAAYISIQKPCECDDNEPHSETDSVSITSTEESSDYPPRRDTAMKSITMREQSKIPVHKSVPKVRTAIPTRRNRVSPTPKPPATAIHKSQSTDMFPVTLRKFDKPREAAVASHTCLNQLDSQTWEVTMNGLTTFVRLIRHHPDIVESHLHAYCVALAKQVKNLRSQVSRSACQASAEFFQTHAKHLETECDDLATQLFNRTADTNKFLRADAFRALASMCDNLTPTKVIHTILTRGATHQNAIVRTTTANLCSRVVSRLGCEKFYTMNRDYRDKLVVAGANFLMEGSLDTRNYAKAFFKQLSTHPQYNRMLQDVIPSRIYRNIEKALRSIK